MGEKLCGADNKIGRKLGKLIIRGLMNKKTCGLIVWLALNSAGSETYYVATGP